MAETNTLKNDFFDVVNHLKKQREESGALKKTIREQAEIDRKERRENTKKIVKNSTKSRFDSAKKSLGNVMDFKSILKPGFWVKTAGMVTETPALMLLGDKLDSLTNKYGEYREATKSSNEKIADLLKGEKVSRKTQKEALVKLYNTTSNDTDKIKKVLLESGVKNKEVFEQIVNIKKQNENSLLSDNEDQVEQLKEQGKNDKEIITILKDQKGILNNIEKQFSDVNTDDEKEIIVKTEEKKNALGFLDEGKEEKQNRIQLRQNELLAEQLEVLKDNNKKEKSPIKTLLGLLGIGMIAFASELKKSLTAMYKPFVNTFKFIFGKDSKLIKGLKFLKNKLKVLNSVGNFFSKESKLVKGFIAFKGHIKKLSSIGDFFSKTFSKIMSSLNVLKGNLNNSIKALSKMPGGKIAKLIGGLAGKLIIPFQMAYRVITEVFNADTIRDKILGASAGILSVMLEIPQMIANGLLRLFGSSMRFDFSAQKIIDATNKITDMVFDNITVPVMDFLTSLPDSIEKMFKMVKDFLAKPIDFIKGFFSNDDEPEKLVDSLEDQGAIDKNMIGNSEIKDWDKISQLRSKEIGKIADYDDWDDKTLERLEKIKAEKEEKEKIVATQRRKRMEATNERIKNNTENYKAKPDDESYMDRIREVKMREDDKRKENPQTQENNNNNMQFNNNSSNVIVQDDMDTKTDDIAYQRAAFSF
jgi:hypothetical protein